MTEAKSKVDMSWTLECLSKEDLISRTNHTNTWWTKKRLLYYDGMRSSKVSLLIGRAAWEIWFNQSEALTRSGKWRVISMEFLRSFLRLHLAGKPVVASPNVDCFLLIWRTNFKSGIRSCSQFKKDTLMSPKCVMRSVDLFAGTRALSVRVAAHSSPRNDGLWGREW